MQNDEESLTLLYNEDFKITQSRVVAMGTVTGFAGLYTKAGGKLTM